MINVSLLDEDVDDSVFAEIVTVNVRVMLPVVLA